jgi:hypothetical protein
MADPLTPYLLPVHTFPAGVPSLMAFVGPVVPQTPATPVPKRLSVTVMFDGDGYALLGL